MTRTLRIIIGALTVSLALNAAALLGVAFVNQATTARQCRTSHTFRVGMSQALVKISNETKNPKATLTFISPLLDGPLAPQSC